MTTHISHISIEERIQTPDAYNQYLNEHASTHPDERAGERTIPYACPIRQWLASLYPAYPYISVGPHEVFYRTSPDNDIITINIEDSWVYTYVRQIDQGYIGGDPCSRFVSYQEALTILKSLI